MTQSIWLASLRAPDGSVLSQEFEGDRGDLQAWNAANFWLLHDALPKMKTVDAISSVTDYAQGRFTDALLSRDGEMVILCDPWEMRLEHYSAEELIRLENAKKGVLVI